jgi:hypothetical protein
MAMIRSARLMDLEAYSARPDSPVVLDREPAHPVRRTRAAAASAMHRVADRLAPATPTRPVREAGPVGC